MDAPIPENKLELKPNPKPRRQFLPGVKANVLGKIGDLFIIEIPITIFGNTTQTFHLVGATIQDGYLEVQKLGGRWKSFYMTKQRIENKNFFEFRYASPLTAITLSNLLAAAQAMELSM